MAPRSDTLAIVPAFNEQDTICAVIDGIRSSAPDVDILVVDDGCTDLTREKARQRGARVVSHPFNLGYGAALQTGFMAAMRGGYSFTVQIDGDGQHDPASIADLLLPVMQGEADLAIGSRFLYGDYRAPFFRRLGMVLFGKTASLVLGRRITDPTSGYAALNQKAVTRFGASPHYPVDFPDADLLVMAHKAGLVITEVPVVMHPSPRRRSMHGGLKPFYYVFKMVLSILMAMLRKNPF